MKCHCKESCIKDKNSLSDGLIDLYAPCESCTTKKLKKSLPIKRQLRLENVDSSYGLCPSCNKRNIDYVMAHILKILIDANFQSESSSIRKVGTPLITPGIYLEKQPYLSEKTLVILIEDIDKKTAERILEEVPEVKGVLKGSISNTVGLLTEKSEVNNYKLLAGCDVRVDIQDSDAGKIFVYKSQSRIHIEYPKKESEKLLEVKEALEEYENPIVVDAMCGVGTLGIYALKKNARRVIFNDLYSEAIDCLKTNLKINEVDESAYEIHNKSIYELTESLDGMYDVGLIDAFPDVDTSEYVDKLKRICRKVIII